MNYYSSDYQMNTDPLVKRMLTTADEIVTLYMAGDSSSRVESLRRTQVYIEQFEGQALSFVEIQNGVVQIQKKIFKHRRLLVGVNYRLRQ